MYTERKRRNSSEEPMLSSLPSLRLLLAILFVFSFLCVENSNVSARSVTDSDLEHLDVFIIPHSHCDPGYRATLSEYEVLVDLILDSVTESLQKAPDRRFIAVESVFIEHWWNKTLETRRQQFRQLVNRGQIEFVLGGWVMEDEAITYYESDINQMTEGHGFVWRTFGIRPRIGWQIDPFGASSFTPTLFALSGFDAYIINRITWWTKDEMKSEKGLEFVWQGQRSIGAPVEIMTHVLDSHYNSPEGFDFEASAKNNPPITPENVANRSDVLTDIFRQRASWYRTNKLLIPFGSDFHFILADVEFDNMDRLIEYINSNYEKYRIHMQYATLSEYFAALHSTNTTFPLKTQGDFFPYVENRDGPWWTGFYTTIPENKIWTRAVARDVRNADSVGASLVVMNGVSPSFDLLQFGRRQDALLQHHDALPGTCMAFVDLDYAQLLWRASSELTLFSLRSLQTLLAKQSSKVSSFLNLNSKRSDSMIESSSVQPVSLVNSLGWTSEQLVEIPVHMEACSGASHLAVVTSAGETIPSQLYSRSVYGSSTEECLLAFVHNLPPVSVETLFVNACDQGVGCAVISSVSSNLRSATVKNSFLSLTTTIEDNTGLHISMQDSRIPIQTVEFIQNFLLYFADHDTTYVFTGTKPPVQVPIHGTSLSLVEGPVFSEIRHSISTNVSMFLRIAHSPLHSEIVEGFVKVGNQVGPIDFNSNLVTRFSSSLSTNQDIFTDASGYQTEYRQANMSCAYGCDFFPVSSYSYIRDTSLGIDLVHLYNSSHGVASMESGSIEVMLHRRELEWSRGDDYAHIHSPLWFFTSPSLEAQRLRRYLALATSYPFQVVSWSPVDSVAQFLQSFLPSFSFLKSDLPPNIHLLSLKVLDPLDMDPSSRTILLRFEHLYEVDEDPKYSPSISLRWSDLFQRSVIEVEERSITDNCKWEDVSRWSWLHTSSALTSSHISYVDSSSDSITLFPKQMRTFRISFASS